MVDPALVGTMLVGGVFLVAVFVAIAQARVSPMATASPGTAPTSEETQPLDLLRAVDRPAGWAVLALVGSALVFALTWLTAWSFFTAVVAWLPLQALVLLTVGSGLALGTFLLLVRDDDAVTFSISFLLFVVGLTTAFMVYVVAPAPFSNLFLYLGLFAVTVSLAHGLVSYGRSIGGGTAGAVFVVSITLFVLVLVGITARIVLGG